MAVRCFLAREFLRNAKLTLATLVNIVIHTASSINPTPALHLISGLGKQRETSGKHAFFVHVGSTSTSMPSNYQPSEQTSGSSAFFESTGWPRGEVKDTGPVFEMEKQLADSFPIRKVIKTVVPREMVS